MKKNVTGWILLVVASVIGIAMVGCGPMKVEKIEQIKSNETAFLVDLEGDTKTNQDMLKSSDYLESKKVATKQISIAQRKKNTGRMPWSYEWIPTQRILKVDRSPVTREWTKGATTGTKQGDQSLRFEDSSGIGFSMGMVITCSVSEPDTASYLYKYSEKPLSDIVDQNVRGSAQAIGSAEYAMLPLSECVSSKKKIADIMIEELRKIYKPFGITIDSLGFSEGITFENPEIQKAIDEKFNSEMKIKSAENDAQALVKKAEGEANAQKARNDMKIEMAKAERTAAEEFAKAQEAQQAKMILDATISAAGKWNGSLPNYLIVSGGEDLMKNMSMLIPSPVAVPSAAAAPAAPVQ